MPGADHFEPDAYFKLTASKRLPASTLNLFEKLSHSIPDPGAGRNLPGDGHFWATGATLDAQVSCGEPSIQLWSVVRRGADHRARSVNSDYTKATCLNIISAPSVQGTAVICCDLLWACCDLQ